MPRCVPAPCVPLREPIRRPRWAGGGGQARPRGRTLSRVVKADDLGHCEAINGWRPSGWPVPWSIQRPIPWASEAIALLGLAGTSGLREVSVCHWSHYPQRRALLRSEGRIYAQPHDGIHRLEIINEKPGTRPGLGCVSFDAERVRRRYEESPPL